MGQMIGYSVLVIGCVARALVLLTGDELFFWHISGPIAIIAGATAVTWPQTAWHGFRRLLQSIWAGSGFLLIILLLTGLVVSWWYVYTAWPRNFMIQILGFGGTGTLVCLAVAWLLNRRSVSDETPFPSDLDISKERKEIFIRHESNG